MNQLDLQRRNFLTLEGTDPSRRGFIGSGLVIGALAALPSAANAQTPDAGRLTCHVLDTYSGRPGGGMRVELSMQDGAAWKLLKSVPTVDNGRTADPLLAGDGMLIGNFMLEFFHAEYFKARAFLPNPPFFDRVTHFFSIPSKTTAYHITMVAAPWGYTTYRWKE